MPETLMSEEVKPGKIIARPERRTRMTEYPHLGNQGGTPQYPTGMMKLTPGWKEPGTTGIL
jgi:hypothetical protein